MYSIKINSIADLHFHSYPVAVHVSSSFILYCKELISFIGYQIR